MEYQHQQCQFLMYFRYRGATKGAEPFFENNVNIDVIQSYASFDEYQVLLLPVMIVYKKEVQEKIREFVKAGKTVLLRFINSVKDYYNNLTLNEFNPINFTDFVGAYVGCGADDNIVNKLEYKILVENNIKTIKL